MNLLLLSIFVFVVASGTVFPVLFSSDDWEVFLAGILAFSATLATIVLQAKLLYDKRGNQ